MDATTKFSLRFAQGSESKAEASDRSLKGPIPQRIAIRTSLIGLAVGFSLLGTLTIVNRHQADLTDLPGGGFIAVAGGVGAILVGAIFYAAVWLHWRFWAKRSAKLLVRPPGPPVSLSKT